MLTNEGWGTAGVVLVTVYFATMLGLSCANEAADERIEALRAENEKIRAEIALLDGSIARGLDGVARAIERAGRSLREVDSEEEAEHMSLGIRMLMAGENPE